MAVGSTCNANPTLCQILVSQNVARRKKKVLTHYRSGLYRVGGIGLEPTTSTMSTDAVAFRNVEFSKVKPHCSFLLNVCNSLQSTRLSHQTLQ